MKLLAIILGLTTLLSCAHGYMKAEENKELKLTITRLEFDLDYAVNVRCKEHPLCGQKIKTGHSEKVKSI
jgi:hypothetical protein